MPLNFSKKLLVKLNPDLVLPGDRDGIVARKEFERMEQIQDTRCMMQDTKLHRAEGKKHRVIFRND
jgi:hypothetical protein